MADDKLEIVQRNSLIRWFDGCPRWMQITMVTVGAAATIATAGAVAYAVAGGGALLVTAGGTTVAIGKPAMNLAKRVKV